jgi:hypothetical protein
MPAKAGIQELLNWFPAFAVKTTENRIAPDVNNIMRLLIYLLFGISEVAICIQAATFPSLSASLCLPNPISLDTPTSDEQRGIQEIATAENILTNDD